MKPSPNISKDVFAAISSVSHSLRSPANSPATCVTFWRRSDGFSNALRFPFDFPVLANASLDYWHSSSFLLVIITYSLTPVPITHQLFNRCIYSPSIWSDLRLFLPITQDMSLFFIYSPIPAFVLHLFLDACLLFFTCSSRYATVRHLFLKGCLYYSPIPK